MENAIKPAVTQIEYDSAKQTFPLVEEFRLLMQYRFLVVQIVRRNIATRYKRSVLGIAWTMINPLATMIILTLVFSQAFRTDAAYILCGIMPWNFFSQTTVACIVDLMWGGQLLHRIFFPRSVFPLAAIGTGLVNLTLALVPLILVTLLTGIHIGWSVLFLPVPMLLLAMFALGVGLFLSTFAVYFPDVSEMYQIAVMAWMYLTPVIYPEAILPEAYRFWITHLNPMYYLIKLYRIPIYESRLPVWGEFWPAVLISLVVLVGGWWFFTSKSDEFAYRL